MKSSVSTFDGYRRPDGRVGVRNHVLVLSPTGLTSAAAQRIAGLVRGTICVTSGFGRGQVAADAQLHFDTLAGLATHPNVAAVLVVSASDDITASYVDVAKATGRPAAGLSLPGCHEDALAMVDAGMRLATRLVRDASMLVRDPCTLSDLCVAVECGHSDATSGIVCNPLAGRMTKIVVASGGQAMFSETVEWTGAEHILASRAATAEVATAIRNAVLERERMARDAGGDLRRQNPGPQNKAGGITTLEEKALGAIAKGAEDRRTPAARAASPRSWVVPDGHPLFLARVHHGHGRLRRADRCLHNGSRQQLLQSRGAHTQDERERVSMRTPHRADRHRCHASPARSVHPRGNGKRGSQATPGGRFGRAHVRGNHR
jgi:altronate dehydratase large subunit